MLIFFTTLLATLSFILRSLAALELENLALRHQLGVLQRSSRKCPRAGTLSRGSDRLDAGKDRTRVPAGELRRRALVDFAADHARRSNAEPFPLWLRAPSIQKSYSNVAADLHDAAENNSLREQS